MKSRVQTAFLIVVILVFIERGHSAVFMQKGTAIGKVLGTKQVFQGPTVKVSGTNRFLTGKAKKGSWSFATFYSKDSKGKPKDIALIAKGFVYPPNCDHEWIVSVDASSRKVKDIQVLEMTCPHAFPTKKRGFLDQFKGKGPKDAKKLVKSIGTEATATGSSELAADFVTASIEAAGKARKKIK